jgi:hypothetical protein
MCKTFTFIETPIFTSRIVDLISDDELAEFQVNLAQNPEKSGPIRGTGGLRKVRWNLEGKGKSGGIRIMYLPLEVHGHLYLIFVFTKGESENLSASETRELKKIADAIKREYNK